MSKQEKAERYAAVMAGMSQPAKRKTWLEMRNGERLATIHFCVWVNAGEGREMRHRFGVNNPPCHEGDANLFTRLSFELIKERFAEWGYKVGHIIRGETSEVSVRDCYVYDGTHKVPIAVIRPEVFVKD